MRKHGKGYYICTDAVDVFHFTELDNNRGFSSEQPYVIFGSTKEVCFEKVFEGRTPEGIREVWQHDPETHVPRDKRVISENSI